MVSLTTSPYCEECGQDTSDCLCIDLTRSEAQQAFVLDDRRYLVWIGGRGSSKTSSTCLHIMRLMHDPDWYGARWLFTAPIYAQIKKGPMITFDDWFGPRGLIIEKINGNEPERRCINGWTVLFRNASNPDSWRGLEIAGGSLDEAAQLPNKTPFQLMNASMRQKRPDGSHYNYQTTITTTPRGKNWLYDEFIAQKKYREEQLGLYLTTTHQAMEAGFLPGEYIANMGYAEGTSMHAQEILGEFISWGGLVFDQNFIVPDAWSPPPMRAVYGGIDIGTSDPTAIIVVGKDFQNRVWVLDEFYETRARFDDWIDRVGEWTKKYRVRKWFVDSDLIQRMIQKAGIHCATPYKARDAAAVSINYINQLIGREMFFVNPKCVALRSEMEGYQYKENTDGDETTILAKIRDGQSDHALDALRYATLPLSSETTRTYGQWAAASFGS